jgi:hypothetical protein
MLTDNWRASSALTAVALALGAGLLGACAPLDQAPLVYSSKTSYGLDVSATSTESPGLSLNLGSKQVDAAYVPIAVAVPCPTGPSATATNCASPTFQIVSVTASNKNSNATSPTALRVQTARQNVQDATTEVVAKQQKVKAATDTRTSDKRDADKANTTAGAAVAPNGASATPPSANLTEDDLAITSANAELDDAKTKLSRATQDLKEALDVEAKSNESTIADAYSVFGTFDGKGNANADLSHGATAKAGGSLTIGKVFSTGIASQNLSAGMQMQYLANCMDRAAALAQAIKQDSAVTQEEKPGLIQAAYGLCSRASLLPLATR